MISAKYSVFIIAVVLGIISDTHEDIPPVEPEGLWYVVAVTGFNKSLSVPECWTVIISEPLKNGKFIGYSDFVDKLTSQHQHVHFKAVLTTDRSSLHNMYHYFKLEVTIDGSTIIFVESIALYQFVTSHGTAVLFNMTIAGQTWNYFDGLYISRTPELDENISPLIFEVMPIVNSNCSSTYTGL